MKYLVWCGGVCVAETEDKSVASSVENHYINEGYDDVCIEEEHDYGLPFMSHNFEDLYCDANGECYSDADPGL